MLTRTIIEQKVPPTVLQVHINYLRQSNVEVMYVPVVWCMCVSWSNNIVFTSLALKAVYFAKVFICYSEV